jgi:3'(2'), 5'-bisphosphate nucleotidase
MPELDLALKAATKAGDAILQVYETNYKTKIKGDGSPVTDADLTSNKIIKDILNESKHYILSEEDNDHASRLSQQTLWVVDPLDGTADFIDRTGEFTVMIGLVQDKKPILGVINWPAGKTIFAAQKGKGAFEYSNNTWNKIHTSNISDLKYSRVIASKNHLTDTEKNLINNLGVKNIDTVGSSLKIGKISSGLADIYLTLTNKMMEWDTCASNCILNEAGGKMTDMQGNIITYNNKALHHQNGILASNRLLHEQILKTLS